jgi:hypothetical protein
MYFLLRPPGRKPVDRTKENFRAEDAYISVVNELLSLFKKIEVYMESSYCLSVYPQ